VRERRVGRAGWAIPRACAEHFPGPGTHLERYARLSRGVEVDSTFYRLPRPGTWLRWAANALALAERLEGASAR
jgi:uncharacterized protein YecE (DUF72 family)